jgi:DNA-binding transcriptional regulator YhcF (GntR family)
MDTLVEPELVIDGGLPVPQQLEGQLRRQILYGILRPGEELPTVRAIAVGLGVNPHAVEEAYGRLQREGFLLGDEGCGPRVAALPGRADHAKLDNWCRDFLQRSTAEGYSLAEVLQVLHAWIDRGASHGESR